MVPSVFKHRSQFCLAVLDSWQTLLGFVHSVVHSSCLSHSCSATAENVTISLFSKNDYIKASKIQIKQNKTRKTPETTISMLELRIPNNHRIKQFMKITNIFKI